MVQYNINLDTNSNHNNNSDSFHLNSKTTTTSTIIDKESDNGSMISKYKIDLMFSINNKQQNKDKDSNNNNNDIEIENKVQEKINEMFKNITLNNIIKKYNVNYLGYIIINNNNKIQSLDNLQEYLKQLYINYIENNNKNNNILEINNKGIKLININKNNNNEILLLFNKIYVWASVKLIINNNNNNLEYCFIPLVNNDNNNNNNINNIKFNKLNKYENSLLIKYNNNNIPIVFIVTKNNINQLLELHGYICNNIEDGIHIAKNLYKILLINNNNKNNNNNIKYKNGLTSCRSINDTESISKNSYAINQTQKSLDLNLGIENNSRKYSTQTNDELIEIQNEFGIENDKKNERKFMKPDEIHEIRNGIIQNLEYINEINDNKRNIEETTNGIHNYIQTNEQLTDKQQQQQRKTSLKDIEKNIIQEHNRIEDNQNISKRNRKYSEQINQTENNNIHHGRKYSLNDNNVSNTNNIRKWSSRDSLHYYNRNIRTNNQEHDDFELISNRSNEYNKQNETVMNRNKYNLRKSDSVESIRHYVDYVSESVHNNKIKKYKSNSMESINNINQHKKLRRNNFQSVETINQIKNQHIHKINEEFKYNDKYKRQQQQQQQRQNYYKQSKSNSMDNILDIQYEIDNDLINSSKNISRQHQHPRKHHHELINTNAIPDLPKPKRKTSTNSTKSINFHTIEFFQNLQINNDLLYDNKHEDFNKNIGVNDNMEDNINKIEIYEEYKNKHRRHSSDISYYTNKHKDIHKQRKYSLNHINDITNATKTRNKINGSRNGLNVPLEINYRNTMNEFDPKYINKQNKINKYKHKNEMINKIENEVPFRNNRKDSFSNDTSKRISSKNLNKREINKTSTTTTGDILTKVAIPRSTSFLKTNSSTRNSINNYTNKSNNSDDNTIVNNLNKTTIENHRKISYCKLGLSELFLELKYQEGLNNINEILNKIININGMSYNELKPIYKEFIIQYSKLLTQDEFYYKCKIIMNKQKKKKKKIIHLNNKLKNKFNLNNYIYLCKNKYKRNIKYFNRIKRNKKKYYKKDYKKYNNYVKEHSKHYGKTKELGIHCCDKDKYFEGQTKHICNNYYKNYIQYIEEYNKHYGYNHEEQNSLLFDNTQTINNNTSSGYFTYSDCNYNTDSCTCISTDKCYCTNIMYKQNENIIPQEIMNKNKYKKYKNRQPFPIQLKPNYPYINIHNNENNIITNDQLYETNNYLYKLKSKINNKRRKHNKNKYKKYYNKEEYEHEDNCIEDIQQQYEHCYHCFKYKINKDIYNNHNEIIENNYEFCECDISSCNESDKCYCNVINKTEHTRHNSELIRNNYQQNNNDFYLENSNNKYNQNLNIIDMLKLQGFATSDTSLDSIQSVDNNKNNSNIITNWKTNLLNKYTNNNNNNKHYIQSSKSLEFVQFNNNNFLDNNFINLDEDTPSSSSFSYKDFEQSSTSSLLDYNLFNKNNDINRNGNEHTRNKIELIRRENEFIRNKKHDSYNIQNKHSRIINNENEFNRIESENLRNNTNINEKLRNNTNENKVLVVSARDPKGRIIYVGANKKSNSNLQQTDAVSIKKSAEIASLFMKKPSGYNYNQIGYNEIDSEKLENSLGYLP